MFPGVNGDNVKAICHALSRNTVLGTLNLSGNHFDREVFIVFQKLQDFRKNSGTEPLILDVSERGPKTTVTKIYDTNNAIAKKRKKKGGKKKKKK